MEAEIAELESFIDSYVGDDCNEPIPTEVFTNSNAKAGDALRDFQEELLQHQKLQEKLEFDFPNGLPPSVGNWTGAPGNDFGIHSDAATDFSAMHGWNQSFQYSDVINPNHPYVMGPYYPMHPSGQPFPPQQPTEGLPPPRFPPYHHLPYAGFMDPTQGHSVSYQMNSNIARVALVNGGKDGVFQNDLRHHLNNKSAAKYLSENGKIPTPKPERQQRPKGKNYSTSKKHEKASLLNGNGDLSWRQSERASPKGRDADRHSIDDRSDASSTDVGEQKNRKNATKQDARKKSSSRHSSQSSSSETSSAAKGVSGRSKAEVRSWLKQDTKNVAQMEKQMGKLAFSPSNHLPRLIKSAQSFITNEKKLREVAEMVCCKAMKNSLSAENGAILCNEMSTRMVNGTSFRTIVLNIVQGHFKNRQRLLATTIKNPTNNSWPGFVTFLVELYLNLRTTSNERLKTLVNPVFDCFFQVLHEKSVPSCVTKCFCKNIAKVGAILQAANPEKMTELISFLRDSCVLPNDLSPEAKRDLLQSLECYARGWKINTLDASYYDNCSSKTLAS